MFGRALNDEFYSVGLSWHRSFCVCAKVRKNMEKTKFSRVRVPFYFIRRGLKFVASVFAVSLFLLNFAGRTNNCDY